MEPIAPEEILCFMFVSLIAGCILTYFLSRVAPNVPYTVLIFIIGMGLGIAVSYSDLGHLGVSIIEWYSIPPQMLLYIFLPPLLFGDAMTMNIYHMKSTFTNSVLLAGPGSLLGTFVLAACCKVMLSYNWDWNLCFTFGAILCATDPVAVITLLKQAQTSPKLTLLIVQEALYNDGAALVLFELFFDGIKLHNEHNFNELGIAIYFIRVIFISPLVGAAVGLGTVFGLRVANRRLNTDDVTIQTILTLCCAYLSFYIGQYLLEVSGVLACCFAGIVVAWLGPPLILEHASMHSVWEALEYTGNTLIFFLAGILIVHGSIALKCGILDFAQILLVYVLLNAIRVAMIALFYPFLTVGLGLRFRDAVFLSFVGLRGAVGTVLGLVLLQSSRLGELNIEAIDGDRAFFLIGGVAALTLLINGTLAKQLLVSLGCVDEAAKEASIIHHYVRIRIHKRVRELLGDLREELQGYDEALVAEFSKVVAVNSVLNQQFSSRAVSTTSVVNSHIPMTSHKVAAPPSRFSMRMTDGAVTRLAVGEPVLDSGSPQIAKEHQSYPRPLSMEAEAMFRIMTVPDEFPLEEEAKARGDLKDFYPEAATTGNTFFNPLDDAFPGQTRGEPSTEVIEERTAAKRKLLEDSKEGEDGSRPSSRRSGSRQSERVPVVRSNLIISVTNLDISKVPLDEKLLVQIRIAFLEVVRSVYWEIIEGGKLRRNAQAARALMYSIDVALDECDGDRDSGGGGLRDWACLQSTINPNLHNTMNYVVHFFETLLSFGAHLHSLLVRSVRDGVWGCASYFNILLEQELKENRVYILSSYIHAHKLAQHKVPHILGEREGVDTYELAVVVRESMDNTELARTALEAIDKDTITFSLSKQVAKILLHMQQEMVEKFQQEGILRPKDADKLVEETLTRHNELKSTWLNLN